MRNGYVYIEIQRGMYRLTQAGILANNQLTERLEPKGYYQCRHTPGLWRHKWIPILFSLVVDDFGIKYVGKKHAYHLIAAIEENYEFSANWGGTVYCGIIINWDYANRTVDLSMTNYISSMLHKYQHPTPKRAQHSPHPWNIPTYGTTQQLTKATDTTDPLELSEVKRIQKIVGTLLFYAQSVDATMLVDLGTIEEQQSIATQTTSKFVNHLLYYCHTHPNAKLRYQASDMILHIHSDTSYNSYSPL